MFGKLLRIKNGPERHAPNLHEVTVRELPIAKTLARVLMRLPPGGMRELHWHTAAEWAFPGTHHFLLGTIGPHDFLATMKNLHSFFDRFP
jgi:hypothetical protein